nr:CpsD/CapB family tyrosine-protein kinase [Anaerolineae bacterium]
MTQPNLCTLSDPRSRVSEAYRTLRTNLVFSSPGRQLRTLVVAGPSPGAGASTAAANLAVTLAQGSRKTILIDCDLRRPVQHEIWAIGQEPGLTTMMVDEALAPPLVDVGVENLWVLPSGPLPPNPADLLGSQKMDEVINHLLAESDYIVFDVPPVIAVTDAALLSSKVDGVLLVLKARGSKRDHAERAKELLERVGAHLLGAILTDAEVDKRSMTY